jgi:hypothetical protein
MSLKLRDMNDTNLKQLLDIGLSVMHFYESKIAESPLLGAKQILIFQGPPCPESFFFMLPSAYLIRVYLNSSKNPKEQFVWQFAHEICHLYIWPSNLNRFQAKKEFAPNIKWNNFFTECICTAMSYVCLSKLNMGPTFEIYRWNCILNSLSKLGNEFNGKIDDILMEQIKSKSPLWIELCPDDYRPEQGACALFIEQELIKYPNSWGALCYLGDATENQITDFNRWSELVTPEQRLLVEALALVFNNK